MQRLLRHFNIALLVFALSSAMQAHAGTLSCTVGTSCQSGTVIYRMSSSTNAHAETVNQSSYTQLVCCSGVTGLGSSCSGTFATALRLATSTNAHAEQGQLSNYQTSACISAPSGGSVSIGYQAGNCTGYDTTLGSMSSSTNAHVGDGNAYSIKICGTGAGAPPQSLTFSISDNTIGFGALSAAGARYATGDTNGATSDAADAHTVTVSTNASSGYALSLSGSTLLCSGCNGATITAIGATAAASSAGNEQFGVRATVNSGSGSVASPYNGSNWALDTAAFPDVIGTGSGDGIATEFGLRYLANISANTDTGSYGAILTYAVTATY